MDRRHALAIALAARHLALAACGAARTRGNAIPKPRPMTPEVILRELGRIMIGDAQECLDTIERYSRVGVTHFLFMTFAPYVEEEMQRFAEEIIPQVRPQVRGR